jgi:hypothetical protein
MPYFSSHWFSFDALTTFTDLYILVIGSSLALITQALSKLGIDISPPPIRRAPTPNNERFQDIHTEGTFLPLTDDPAQALAAFGFDGTFEIPAMDSLNLDGFEITPELFEAFSTLEPVSATVGTLQDFH